MTMVHPFKLPCARSLRKDSLCARNQPSSWLPPPPPPFEPDPVELDVTIVFAPIRPGQAKALCAEVDNRWSEKGKQGRVAPRKGER